MRTLKRTLVSAMAMACVLGVATTSMAQNNNLDEVGAALALPVITDWETNTVTFNVVTNVSSDDLVLHVNVINGYDWSAFDFSCYVTASETTLFRFRPLDDYSLRLIFECTNPQTGEAEPEEQTIDVDSGIMFVALEDPQGGTVNQNAIFGDSVVVSFEQGYAWSVGAVSFQGIVPDAPGVDDRDYRFDGMEYSNFPSVLATNFIAPTSETARVGIDAELILFTLDGTTGISPGPNARLNIIFYNDDERPFSTSYAFDCFSIVRLTDIDSRFQRGPAYLDSAAGHMFMTPQITTQTSTTHDFLFDGPASNGFDGQRRTPVHGWLVQTIHVGAKVCDFDACGQEEVPRFENNGAWARTLNQSTMALSPSTGDVPTLSTTGNPF